MLQDIDERQDFPSAGIITVADNLIVRIVSRNNIFQGTVCVGLLQAQARQVERVVDRKLFRQVLQVERIKTGLRFPKGEIHRTHLQDIVRVTRGETQCLSAIHDIFTQSEGDIGNAIFRLLVADRVEIQ